MRAIVTNLTAGLLFIHTVFGCCWHHAHDCDHCVAKTGPSTGLTASCCGHDEADDNQPAEPCHCEFECQGVCTYLPPEKTTVEAPAKSIASLDLLAVLPTAAATDSRGTSHRAESHGLPPLAGSLRLHLWHRILLI